MKVETILTIAAQCDRAARDGANEDNCLVVSPVGCKTPTVNHFGDVAGFSEVVPLRDKGCLLVVADGMGGMNAGEVASHIAVTTLAKCFSEEGLKNVELTDNTIRKFLRKSIVAADDAIKKTAAKDKEKEGMGTTVVLLWILPDNTAYYAWCGDSRLYRYTSDMGLQTLSHDHSYVMEILHLSEEEAFVHPNNNIITRSLGNPSEKANPEIEGPFQIYKDDLFLLCSDGLCGVLPSQKIDENIPCIEDILEEHIPDADHLIDGINELWTAAATAGWHDNVTTLLCQVKEGPKRPAAKKKPKAMQTNKSNTSAPPAPSAAPRDEEGEKKRGRRDTLIALLVVALIAAITAGTIFGMRYFKKSKAEITKQEQSNQNVLPKDALPQKVVQEEEPPVAQPGTYAAPPQSADVRAQHRENQSTSVTSTAGDNPQGGNDPSAPGISVPGDGEYQEIPNLPPKSQGTADEKSTGKGKSSTNPLIKNAKEKRKSVKI